MKGELYMCIEDISSLSLQIQRPSTLANSIDSDIVIIGNGITGDCTWKKYYKKSDNIITLDIIGNGAMEDYDLENNPAPWDCHDLIKINILDGVTHIGNLAFYESFYVTDIIIPNTVITIGEYAFSTCGLTGQLIIPNSVTEIATGAFSDCDITSVILSNNLISIGSSVFGSCHYLQEVQNLHLLANNLFQGCTSLDLVTLFNNLDNNITTIPVECFRGAGLWQENQDISLPEGLLRIENRAFENGGVTNIIFPNSLTYLDSDSFNLCEALLTAYLPNIEQVKEYVFRYSENMTDIYCQPASKPSGWDTSWADDTGSAIIHWGATPPNS